MRRAADKLVTQSKERYVHPTNIAMFQVHAEEKDEALKWLETAYEGRDPSLHSVGVEPDWEGLHPEPRFQALLDHLGLSIVMPNSGR
jgi:aromatic ring-cleaving dioxygenase